MVKEVSYGYPHGKMSSICLKFNALCDVFNATKGKVSTVYCKPFFLKQIWVHFPLKIRITMSGIIPLLRRYTSLGNEREKYVKVKRS